MYKLILQIGCILFISSQVLAAAPGVNDYANIRFTVHNLSYNPNDDSKGISNPYRNIAVSNSNATEVCVFCHTPHNASPAIPLWNKSFVDSNGQPTALSYQMYTSSPRLSTAVKQSSLSSGSMSLLCLSCHDGKSAINVLHNTSAYDATTSNGDYVLNMGIVGANPLTMDRIASGGLTYTDDIGATRDQNDYVVSGGSKVNLTDDHPLGFSYTQALNDTDPITGVQMINNNLRTLSDALSRGVRFFGPSNTVECSSCHNPHVYYGQGKMAGSRNMLPYATTQAQLDRTPFLVRDNNGSALCLACHIK